MIPITGRVQFADGTPAAGAAVGLARTGGLVDGARVVTAPKLLTTDGSGVFAGHLVPGSVTIRVSVAGRAYQTVRAENPGPAFDGPALVPAVALVADVLLPSGAPKVGATVRLVPAHGPRLAAGAVVVGEPVEAVTDAAGRLSVALVPGAYVATITASDGRAEPPFPAGAPGDWLREAEPREFLTAEGETFQTSEGETFLAAA